MSNELPPPTPAQLARGEQPRVIAPTLTQFWRSDVRRTPGRKPSRWAGRTSLITGTLSVLLLIASGVFQEPVLVQASLALSLTAGFFGLVAVIADVGRAAGVLGLILAAAGNVVVVGWLAQLFA